jgi:hypothetical protein
MGTVPADSATEIYIKELGLVFRIASLYFISGDLLPFLVCRKHLEFGVFVFSGLLESARNYPL